MSLILNSGKLVNFSGGLLSIASGGGGGTPAQPAAIQLFSSGQAGHLYHVAAIPAHGSGGVITGAGGVLSPSGIPGTASVLTSPMGGITGRVDYHNVPNSAQTATGWFTNAAGNGTPSVSSNSATPAVFTDTYKSVNATYAFCGGSVVGMSSLWRFPPFFDFSNCRMVTPGTSTTTSPSYNASYCTNATAPAYPSGFGLTNQEMIEVLPSQSGTGYAFLLSILQDNPAAGNNGAFDISPYTGGKLFFMMYVPSGGVTSGNGITTLEFTANYQGFLTAVGGGVQTDSNQNFGSTFSTSLSAMFDQTSSSASAITANTATSVTSGVTASPGDVYNAQWGDNIYGTNVSDFATYVVSPNAGVFTAGVFNAIEIPLSVLGIIGNNNNLLYKIGIAFAVPSGTGAGYLINGGFSVS